MVTILVSIAAGNGEIVLAPDANALDGANELYQHCQEQTFRPIDQVEKDWHQLHFIVWISTWLSDKQPKPLHTKYR